ncbi:UDP-glucuronosyltransferase 2C1-like [Glandiceps talaboti]
MATNVFPAANLHVVVFLATFVLFPHFTLGYKILVLPGFSVQSTYNQLAKYGEHLAAQGHDVTMVINKRYYGKAGIHEKHAKIFRLEFFDGSKSYEEFKAYTSNAESKIASGDVSLFDVFALFEEVFARECDDIFSDSAFLQRLREHNFDIVIANTFVACPMLIAKHLSLPFVGASINRIAPMADGRLIGVPSNPAYVPELMTGLSDKMNFFERVKNTMHYMASYIMWEYFFWAPYKKIKEKYNIVPDMTFHEVFRSAEIYFVYSDFAFEFARPLMPNVIPIGGLSASPAESLNEELENFVQSSGDDGFVVFCLGSQIEALPVQKAEIFAAGLAKLPQKVIMKYNGPELKAVGDNTKIMKWIPQNDLLGHPKIKAIVYHGGLNGVYEIVYHGVPMVGIPLFTDQFDNLKRMQKIGMAEGVDLHTLTPEDLYDAITMVISDPSYKENAQRVSRIHRDTPMSAGETVVYWVEHVIRHGGQHLRPEAMNLNFIQYYLIDVFLFMLFVTMVIIVIVKKTLCFAIGLCTPSGGKDKSE